MTLRVVLLVACLFVSSACTRNDASTTEATLDQATTAPTSDASSTAQATPAPATPARISIIDWVDFIRLDGVVYLNTSATIGTAELGPQLATVQFNVADHITDPSYRSKDGDAAFLDAGTPVYEIRGYAREFRVAAEQGGQLRIYEADTNPTARRGSDLLDIGGRVSYIGINSPTDGTTELAVIDDPDEVATLVDLVMAAPADQTARNRDGSRYFIAFHLSDGTRVTRAYWMDSGDLQRGIQLPAQFAAAVERALTGGVGQ